MRKISIVLAYLLVGGAFGLAGPRASAAPSGAVPGLVYYSRALSGPTNGTVWRMRGNGSLDQQVTVGEWPRLTPDGRYMAFHRDNPNFARANIYVRDLQTGAERRIFQHGDWAVYYDWRPNGASLVFDYFCSIYEINRDGTNFRNLLGGANCYDDAPAVRPDGTLIAFHNVNQGIGVFNSNGSGRRILPTGTNVVWPSWSPDGQWIAYLQGPNLFKIRPDGTGRAQLTTFAPGSSVFGGTAWTADGSRILVAGTIDGANGVHAVSSAGGSVIRLTASSGAAIDWVGSFFDFPPVAQNVNVTTSEDTAANVTLQGSDPEGFAVTYEIVSGPQHGALGGVASNAVEYAPAADYNGPDGFTYRAFDGSQYSAPATVSILVSPANDPPTALDDSATTPQYREVVVDVLANDYDVDGDSIGVTALTQPAHGTAEGGPDGKITYTPDHTFKGDDQFSYTIADPSGSTDVATVTIDELGCGEDGLDALQGTPLEGTLSRTIDRDVEPIVGAHDSALAAMLHELNCEVVVGAENAADELVP